MDATSDKGDKEGLREKKSLYVIWINFHWWEKCKRSDLRRKKCDSEDKQIEKGRGGGPEAVMNSFPPSIKTFIGL